MYKLMEYWRALLILAIACWLILLLAITGPHTRPQTSAQVQLLQEAQQYNMACLTHLYTGCVLVR